MRPDILFPLFSHITTLPGIGIKTAQSYKRLTGEKIIDVLYHMPSSLVDRRAMPDIMNMREGDTVTAIVKVEQHLPPARPTDKNSPYKVRCFNETGFLTLVFFRAYPDHIKKILPVGEVRVVSGKVERFGGEVQIAHPDYIVPVKDLANVAKVEPVYPLAVGVTQRNFCKTLNAALQKPKPLPEWIDPHFLTQQQWPGWFESISKSHHPQNDNDVLPSSPQRSRLAYDELLASQLALKLVRKYVNKCNGQIIKGDGTLRRQLLEVLPFELTPGQQEVIKQINADQETTTRMMRLLQGDVGSGKTVVALFAMLAAVEAGKQAALMVPTEILSKQHMRWIENTVQPLGVKVALLIGAVKGAQRKQVLEQLAAGEIDIIIGTHALFQEAATFADLGLVVIDEQHRFGVEQRLSLAKKGTNVDMLLMTATPIPRTLTLAAYGDMDSSRLTEKPAGRKKIDTRILSVKKIDQVLDGLGRAIEKGNKIYWICPLVEESEKIDLAAAEDRFAEFSQLFGAHKVGMVHGRMNADEREEVMVRFRDGEADILVATTVIEVGVDVPDATIIVIEHAERFGLSQLHQLRGRVGRNDKQSSCILLYHNLGEISRKRLEIMRESDDGFYLAEEDLKLRGGGEVLGTKQSGLPDFKLADLSEHYELLKIANDDSKLIIENDPQLQTPRGQALKVLLYLFGYDVQAKYVKAG